MLRGDETTATAHLERVDALALLDLAFTWRWELRGIALRARMEPARADELRDLARARGCRKYEALALAALGRAEEAAAVARPLGSDLLLTHVAPVAEARAAAERVAARLPAELRKTYVLRG